MKSENFNRNMKYEKVTNRNHRAEDTITDLKTSIKGFNGKLQKQKKGSANSKTGQWNLLNQRSKNFLNEKE